MIIACQGLAQDIPDESERWPLDLGKSSDSLTKWPGPPEASVQFKEVSFQSRRRFQADLGWIFTRAGRMSEMRDAYKREKNVSDLTKRDR